MRPATWPKGMLASRARGPAAPAADPSTDKPAIAAIAPTSRSHISLCGIAAVDHQARSRHEPAIVRGEEQDALGDVAGDAQPADRVIVEKPLARRLEIVGAQVARPRGHALHAHVGLDQTGVNRVHPDAIALAAELEGARLREHHDT